MFQRHASKTATLAIEPKFVIPEIGAVGVENTYVVAPDGLQNITRFPEEIRSANPEGETGGSGVPPHRRNSDAGREVYVVGGLRARHFP